MKDYIVERVKEVGNFILDSNATIRQAGKVFGVSKSTIHKDIKRLEKIDPSLYTGIDKMMDEHTAVRHIRGGEATRQRWVQLKEDENV